MNKIENKHIESLIKENLGKNSLEHAKEEFVSNLMGLIENVETEKSPVTKYEPLISPITWIIISSVILGIFISILFLPNVETYNFALDINSLLPSNQFYKSIIFSNIFIYSIISLSVFFVFDIFLLTKLSKYKYT